MPTMEQQRAAYALKKVKEYEKKPEKKQGEFKSYANKLPFMIHANGLGQALAFYRSKKAGDAHRDLFDVVSGWLLEEGQPFAQQPGIQDPDALTGLTTSSMTDYMAAQAEAIMLMTWVKKFARAFLKGKENVDSDTA